jgi:hypothetical protein
MHGRSARLLRAGLAFAALAAPATVAGSAAADGDSIEERLRKQEERLAAAEARIHKQDAEIAALKIEAARAKPAPAPSPADAPPPPAAPSPPADRPWDPVLRAVRVSGFVQADAVLHNQASQDQLSPSGQPLNQDRFSIPRAHLRVDAEKWMLLAAIELEASTLNGPAVRAVEASLSFQWQGPDRDGPPLLVSTLGLMKIPFGFEVPELDPARHFLERSTVARALFPGTYDLGFRVQGGFRFLRWAVAVMNGEPIGEQTFPARDPHAAKDIVGRVGVDASPTPPLRIRGGVSLLTGTGLHAGTPATKPTLVWNDQSGSSVVQITDIDVIPGAPATPSLTFSRFALGVDLGVTARLPVIGELTVYGEIVRATNLDRGVEPADPVSAGRDLRELGYYVGVTQELTRHAMIGARYDWYDPDGDATVARGVSVVPASHTYSTLALTASGRHPPGRIIFEYDHNTNNLGLTAGGLPTTLADDAWTLRGEVVF